MTRRLSHFILAIVACLFFRNADAASQEKSLLGFGDRFNLSEPDADAADEERLATRKPTPSVSNAGRLWPRLLVARPGKGQQPDFSATVDSMQRDGLLDSFSNRHMGEQAEELAAIFNISRETQDAFAARSQHLFGAALARGDFADEIVAVGKLTTDQHPRPDVTPGELALLPPVFQTHERNGTVTAGNASGIIGNQPCLATDGVAELIERLFAVACGLPLNENLIRVAKSTHR